MNRLAILNDSARLLRNFSDDGLHELIAAAREGRLRRGTWTGGVAAGCPLSCADGVAGAATHLRFLAAASTRNRFVRAWDAGHLPIADLVALADLELDRRASQPVRRPVGQLLRPLANPFRRPVFATSIG